MATGPVAADSGEDQRAEHDALAHRLADSEVDVQRLTKELAEAREQNKRLTAELAQAREQSTRLSAELAARPAESSSLSLFEGGEDRGGRLTGDGSDPRILSLILGATAVVAGMVTVISLLNGTLVTPFGIVILLLTVVLAWGAMRTRVEPIEVSVVRGLVYVKKGETTHRFDVRNASTQVEEVGTPGEAGWELRFARRGMDPFVINASMVDATDFMAQLRQWRSDL